MVDDLALFESPRLLVDGAKVDIAQFETACKMFISSCGYDIHHHTDPNTREKVIKLRLRKRLQPALRVQAYRIVNDLRNALDQAACDAALASGVTDVSNIYFPFGKSATDVDNRIATKCVGMHADLHTFLRTFQPYLAGDRLLYELSRLANPNKHQRILRMSTSDSGTVWHSNERLSVKSPFAIGINKWNELRNEIEWARVGVGGHIQGDFSVPFKVVLGEGVAPFADPAPTVLGTLAGKVERIVVGLEGKCRHLGLIP